MGEAKGGIRIMTTTVWDWEKAAPVREPVGEWIFTPEGDQERNGRAQQEMPGREEIEPETCSVALLGDGTVACEYFPPANRPENHLLVRLRKAFPEQRFVVQNLGAPGETPGSLLRSRRLERIFASLPQLHLAFIRYNIDEEDADGVQGYIRSLKQLGDALREQYPGLTLIFETGIWVHHPAHCTGDSHARLGTLYDQVRGWATEVGYPVIDVYGKMQAEAAKGNWDLRVRGLPSREHVVLDDSFDAFFGEEPLYYANIHPNSRCLGLIADWEVTMLRQLARKI
jgi:hypothetical protein